MDCGGTGLASHRAGLRRAALNRNGALLGLVIFPATFLASVLGYVNLANLLGNGALKSAYVAAALDAAFRIVEGLIIIALRVRPLALSRVVRLHRSLLQRRLCGIARFLAVLVWLSLTLKFFALQDSLMRYGGAALEAKLTIGFLNISLGQVLVSSSRFGPPCWCRSSCVFFSRKTSTTIGGRERHPPSDLDHGSLYCPAGRILRRPRGARCRSHENYDPRRSIHRGYRIWLADGHQ